MIFPAFEDVKRVVWTVEESAVRRVPVDVYVLDRRAYLHTVGGRLAFCCYHVFCISLSLVCTRAKQKLYI